MALPKALIMPQFQAMTSDSGIIVRDWRLYLNSIETALIGVPVSPANGGTGVNNGTSTITIGGNVHFSGAFSTTITVTGATSVTLPTSGTLVSTTTGAALTKTDDTNVTLTLGGTPAGALVLAASISVGWTGTLAVVRGGIGVGTLASNGVLYGNAASPVQALAVNATATNKYLQQVSSGAPAWSTIPAAEIVKGAFTQGSVLFMGASVVAEDNANLFWDATNHRIGMRTALPVVPTHLSVDGTTPAGALYSSSNDALLISDVGFSQARLLSAGTGKFSSVVLASTRGTLIAPTTMVTGDVVGELFWQGFDGTNRIAAADITVKINGTVAVGQNPSDILFNVYPAGAAVEALRITSAGFVGINTNPSTPLHINTSVLNAFRFTGAGTGGQYLRFISTGADAILGVEDSVGGTVITGGLPYATVLTSAGATALHLGVNDTVKVTVSAAGNVGIGTTNPGAKLDVVDTTSQTTIIDNNGQFRIDGNSANGQITSMLFGFSGGNPIAKIAVEKDASGSRFHFGLSTNYTTGITADVMTILQNGNVGIGATSPTAVIHLKAGTATASTAPFKMTSGVSLTSPEPGAWEFTADDYYATITTGAARKGIVLNDGANLTSGKMPVATTNGRLVDTTIASLVTAGVAAICDTVALTNQGADIGSTNFANGGTVGTYRVSYTIEDTTADVTAGTVTLTIAWTDDAGATTVTAVQALTGVGRTSGMTHIQLASGNIAYSTTHAGIFGTAKYAVFMTLERLS